MLKLLPCISVLAVQMKNSHTAKPNYRPLCSIIICINSKMSDTDMGDKGMEIIRIAHKNKLVALFSKLLLLCLYSCCAPSSNYSDSRLELHFHSLLHLWWGRRNTKRCKGLHSESAGARLWLREQCLPLNMTKQRAMSGEQVLSWCWIMLTAQWEDLTVSSSLRVVAHCPSFNLPWHRWN